MDEREADEAPWERNLKTRGRLLRRSTSHEDALRYYVYVSDTKIDQLFAQIPSKLLKKISIETSIDLKVIRLTVKQNPSEENRISRLRVVERFIHQKGEVGTVDQPAQWIQGTLNLRWGPLPRSVRDPLPTGLDPVRTSGDDFWTMPAEELGFVHSNVVFFVGRSDRNLIGMCGSMRHVLGAAPTTPNDPRTWGIGSVGFTTTSTLEAWLGQPIELESEPESLVDHSLPSSPTSSLGDRNWQMEGSEGPASEVSLPREASVGLSGYERGRITLAKGDSRCRVGHTPLRRGG